MSQTFRGACTGVALAIAAIILYESTQERGQPGIPELSTNEAYIGHFAVYAVMTFCVLVAMAPRSIAALTAVLLASAGLGVVLELYQAQLITRTASVGDAFANAAGGVSGVVAYLVLTMMLEPSHRNEPTNS